MAFRCMETKDSHVIQINEIGGGSFCCLHHHRKGIKLARIRRRNMDIPRHANSMWRRSCGFHPIFLHVTAFYIDPSFVSGPVFRRNKRNFWTIVLAGFLSIQGPVCIRRKFWTIRRLRQCCLLAFRVGRENASDSFEERPEAWQTCTNDAEGKLGVGPDTCRHIVPCQSVRVSDFVCNRMRHIKLTQWISAGISGKVGKLD